MRIGYPYIPAQSDGWISYNPGAMGKSVMAKSYEAKSFEAKSGMPKSTMTTIRVSATMGDGYPGMAQ